MTRLLCCVLFGLCATSLYGQTHEAEPNDTAATATKVELGVTAIGELRWIGVNKYEADWWTFDATAGDTLRFVSGAALPSTSMQLYGDDGVTLLADEVRDAPELRYAITRTGTYFLKLSGVAENGTTPATTDYYEIGLYTNREPNDIPSQARVVALGERVIGFPIVRDGTRGLGMPIGVETDLVIVGGRRRGAVLRDPGQLEEIRAGPGDRIA